MYGSRPDQCVEAEQTQCKNKNILNSLATVIHKKKRNLMRPVIAKRLCTPGTDEQSMLRSGWYSCIKSDQSISFFWSTMLPNISGCLKLNLCVGLANKCLH